MAAKWIKEYFNFTYKERIGILTLLGLILIVFFLPDFFPSKLPRPSAEEQAAFEELVKAFHKDSTHSVEEPQSSMDHLQAMSEMSPPSTHLFPFDPNTASFDEWKQLGIRERTIHIIHKYLAKGGRFNKPVDLKKIYGFQERDFNRLVNFIQINDVKNTVGAGTTNRNWSSSARESEAKPFNRETAKPAVIEINTADSAEFTQLPGIGPVLASRIVRFRDRLGGFYSVEQVSETYGLPDSTFQKIKTSLILGSKPVIQININVAEASDLKNHPYIGWAAARALVEFRRQHGPFKRMEDLLQVSAILPEQLKRLIPYLSID